MKFTIKIPDSNIEKAAPLIAFLSTIDYIELEQEDQYHIPENHKAIVKERLYKNSEKELLNWEQIKDSFNLK